MNYSIKQKLQQAQALIDEAMNTNVGTIGHADLPATALARKQQLLSGTHINREAFDVVHAINVLAMANTDVIHVNASVIGHENGYLVHAFTSEKGQGESVEIFRTWVDLSKSDALKQLLAIESQLTELIIEARENAEVEVTA